MAQFVPIIAVKKQLVAKVLHEIDGPQLVCLSNWGHLYWEDEFSPLSDAAGPSRLRRIWELRSNNP
ncbi:MAG: hypothetical protein ACR2PG_23855 [Hyphomicrobiaceae bacterium]